MEGSGSSTAPRNRVDSRTLDRHSRPRAGPKARPAVSSVIENTFSTPEPAAFALLGTRLLGLCRVRRRRRT